MPFTWMIECTEFMSTIFFQAKADHAQGKTLSDCLPVSFGQRRVLFWVIFVHGVSFAHDQTNRKFDRSGGLSMIFLTVKEMITSAPRRALTGSEWAVHVTSLAFADVRLLARPNRESKKKLDPCLLWHAGAGISGWCHIAVSSIVGKNLALLHSTEG
jgi:hypothetical protein